MVQSITPELTALLVSKLQVGAAGGFRAKLEIDRVQAPVPATPPDIVQMSNTFTSGGGNLYQHFGAATTPGPTQVLVWIGLWRQLSSSPQSPNDGETWESIEVAHFYDDHDAPDPCELTAYKARVTIAQADHVLRGPTGGSSTGVLIRGTMYELSGADYDSITAINLQDQSASFALDVGDLGVLDVGKLGLLAVGSGDDGFHTITADPLQWTVDHFAGRDEDGGAVNTFYFEGFPVGWWGHILGDGSTDIEARVDFDTSHTWGGLAVVVGPDAAHGGSGGDIAVVTETFQIASLDLDRSRKLVAAQLDALLSNEDASRGYYTSVGSFLVPNNPIRAYVTYGDPGTTDWVQVFTGLIDRVHEHRNPRSVAVKARSRMKWLIEQSFRTTAPQSADETGAVRTEDNGVYISKSPEYIAGDILDRAGWPSADRDMGTSGVTIDEYDLTDQSSWAEQVSGGDRLTTAAGFDFWEDELGIAHFKANALADGSEPDPDYSFAAGIDVLALDHEADDEDRATRVEVSGPMTSAVPSWTEEWSTSVLRRPVGMAYRPSESGYIYAIDEKGYLSKIRQADRVVVQRWNLGGSLSYTPHGLTTDPIDTAHFYVLDADFPDGGTTHAKVQKFAWSDKSHTATYSLPDGGWTGLKTDGSNLWLTNWGDDKLYKRTMTATAVSLYSYAGHTNPTGLYIDGTTIGIRFNATEAFYLVDTSAPGTITGTQSTAGTNIFGGEVDTTTHTDLYVDYFDGSAGYVEKFALATLVTTDVVQTAIDFDLEDALGFQSGIADRDHIDCPNIVGPHAFEIRWGYYPMKVVNSTAQALAVAEAQLALLERIRRVLDLGTLGNPAIQIDDVIRYTDPVAGIASVWLLDSYRAQLTGGGTYVTSLSALPWEAPA